jgi:hypothetical protein
MRNEMFSFHSEVDRQRCRSLPSPERRDSSGLQLAHLRSVVAITGAFLSLFVLAVETSPAHEARSADGQSQSVFLHLKADPDAELVTEFGRRLSDYDGLRHRLDASLPPLAVDDNPAIVHRLTVAHHAALRSARYRARQGDIFFESIADRFRSWIRDWLHGMPPSLFVAMITESDAMPVPPPAINGSYPDGAALTTMPPGLLQVLPTLPAGLEYRFIDRDLILWDPHANLIVDYIPNVLAPADAR